METEIKKILQNYLDDDVIGIISKYTGDTKREREKRIANVRHNLYYIRQEREEYRDCCEAFIYDSSFIDRCPQHKVFSIIARCVGCLVNMACLLTIACPALYYYYTDHKKKIKANDDLIKFVETLTEEEQQEYLTEDELNFIDKSNGPEKMTMEYGLPQSHSFN